MGDWHPECPARLLAIDDQLIASGLAALLERREAPLAAVEDLELVHGKQAIDRISHQLPPPGEYTALDPDTLLNQHSWRVALRAAGAAIAATDAVMAGASPSSTSTSTTATARRTSWPATSAS